MKLYTCKVRLGGNVNFEVPKEEGLTAAEIMVLRAIHGTDALVDLKVKEGAVYKGSDFALRAKMRADYNCGVDPSQDLLVRIFGHDSLPLPKELPEIQIEDVPVLEPEEPVKAAEPVEVKPARKLELKRADGTKTTVE